MSKIYNGIGDLPKGKRYGTPQEALEMKQVRRYGKLKIDPRIVEKIEKKELIPETREKLLLKLAGLRGSINRNKGRYETTKDESAKAKYYEVWQESIKEAEKVIKKLKKIEQERDKDKVTKKAKKEKVVKQKTGHSNWIAHVRQVAKDENISYKEALSVASKTYKK